MEAVHHARYAPLHLSRDTARSNRRGIDKAVFVCYRFFAKVVSCVMQA
jgi:hypothetical protein